MDAIPVGSCLTDIVTASLHVAILMSKLNATSKETTMDLFAMLWDTDDQVVEAN